MASIVKGTKIVTKQGDVGVIEGVPAPGVKESPYRARIDGRLVFLQRKDFSIVSKRKISVGTEVVNQFGELGVIEDLPHPRSVDGLYRVSLGGPVVLMERHEFRPADRQRRKNPEEVMTESGAWVVPVSPALRAAVETWLRGGALSPEQVKLIKKHGVNPKGKYVDAAFWAGEIVPEMTRSEVDALIARKPNPAGWMQEESSAAVRRAIQTRHPADIQRARDLQVRNERARDKERHGRKRNPGTRKNGACACGCGGACGKKNPRKNPAITWGRMNYGGIGHAPNDKNAYVVKFINRSQAYPTEGYEVLHDNYYTKISRDASGRHVSVDGEIVKDYYPSMEKGTFFYTMEDAMRAAELHAMKHPVAAPVPKARKTRAPKAR